MEFEQEDEKCSSKQTINQLNLFQNVITVHLISKFSLFVLIQIILFEFEYNCLPAEIENPSKIEMQTSCCLYFFSL